MIEIESVRLAGGMELWFHLKHLPAIAKLHKKKQMPTMRYAYMLQKERDFLTGLTLALAQLVDALGDEIAELTEGANHDR